jgi:hypothetical protein
MLGWRLSIAKTTKTKMKKTTLKPVSLACAPALAAALGLAAFLATSSAYAQNVTFGSAQAITGDANLIDSTTMPGSIYVDGILPNGDSGFGGSTGNSLTADGVTFNAATFSSTSTSDGKITLTANNFNFSQYGNNGGGFPTSASASSDFAAVMTAGGIFSLTGGSGGITISSSALITGHNYDVQIFDYSNDGQNESTTFTSGSSSVTLFDDDGSGNGYFATGTFIATGSDETINFSQASGPYTPVVGAISLYDITSVPEPSTSALVLGGMLLFVLALRNRFQAAV